MNIEWRNGRLDLAYRDLKSLSPNFLRTYTSSAVELDLTGNQFTDVPWISEFTSLGTLVLDGNRIHSHSKLGKVPSLHTLCVNSNNIEDLSPFLEIIRKAYPSLRYLSMLNNVACPNFLNQGSLRQYHDYRLKVISRIPGILFLDSTKVTHEERQAALMLESPSLPLSRPMSIANTISGEVTVLDDPGAVQRRQTFSGAQRSAAVSEGGKSQRRRSSARKITVPGGQSPSNSPTLGVQHITPTQAPISSFGDSPDLTSKGVLITSHLSVHPNTSAYMEEAIDPPTVQRFHRPSVDETSLSLQIALTLRNPPQKLLERHDEEQTSHATQGSQAHANDFLFPQDLPHVSLPILSSTLQKPDVLLPLTSNVSLPPPPPPEIFQGETDGDDDHWGSDDD